MNVQKPTKLYIFKRCTVWYMNYISNFKKLQQCKKRDHILLKCRCYKRQKLHMFVHTYIWKENEDKANVVKY